MKSSPNTKPKPEKPYVYGYKCQRCPRPVVYPGKCFRCGTGRERTLLRPEERA